MCVFHSIYTAQTSEEKRRTQLKFQKSNLRRKISSSSLTKELYTAQASILPKQSYSSLLNHIPAQMYLVTCFVYFFSSFMKIYLLSFSLISTYPFSITSLLKCILSHVSCIYFPLSCKSISSHSLSHLHSSLLNHILLRCILSHVSFIFFLFHVNLSPLILSHLYSSLLNHIPTQMYLVTCFLYFYSSFM